MLRSKLATMKLTVALLILTVPLSGCGVGDLLRLFAPQGTRVLTIIECPTSPGAPPEAVLDALEGLMDDAETRAWVDAYDRHLQKLDDCS